MSETLATYGVAPPPTFCTCPEHGRWYKADDVDRNVDIIDLAMNGPKRASSPAIIDVAAQMRDLSEKFGPIAATTGARTAKGGEANHKLDTDTHVFFYEQDFYVLSNFSAFTLYWDARENMRFDTSEAAYHWEKFHGHEDIQCEIINAPSAHEAFKVAERNKIHRRADWDAVKFDVMRDILRAKAAQHEYVRRKLLATGDRILVEDSWRDDVWGWGPNRDGQNMLGKLWMEIRAELRASPVVPAGGKEA